jgi:hypothetical protein
MARRDLSRTVIEGGRYRHNKYFRRASHGTGRAREREWLDAVEVDADIADERALRERPKVHRMFYDKLAVPKRWLRSRVGRPWNKVYSEMLTLFDPRTIAGQHIVYDHMIHFVRRPGDDARDRSPFEVDAHGILRAVSRRRKRRKPPAWTNGRFATKQERRWWWVVDGTIVEPMTKTQIRRVLAMPPRERGVVLWGTWASLPERFRLPRR